MAQRLDQPEQRPKDPFAPIRIIVGSKGMERWLRHQLAMRLDAQICANVEFPFPAQVISEALAALEGKPLQPGDELAPDPWRPEALTWALLEVLPNLLSEESTMGFLAPLEKYLAGKGKDAVGPREWELVNQVADVFDRTVMYRPDLARAWSEGTPVLPEGISETELGWQPRLWEALANHLHPETHAAARWQAATASVDTKASLFNQPLRFFGVTALPPTLLQHLAWLSRHYQMEFFLLCPSDRYWNHLDAIPVTRVETLLKQNRDHLGEKLHEALEASGSPGVHPLLLSLGRIGRDLQLYLKAHVSEDCVKSQATFFDPAAAGSAPSTPKALHLLQSDILNLRDPLSFTDDELSKRALATDDDSIRFHACYGPTRQVEVLRETLLHLFEDHPDLEPRDVLVMTPDIEGYVPLIGAVFDQGRDRPLRQKRESEKERWGSHGAPRIPYIIAERSLRQTNAVAEVLLRTLDLACDGRRITSTAVLDMFAIEPFRRRFGIASEDLDTIRQWVEESGIRWAMDAADRHRHGQPANGQNSWRFGMERLALGVVMADEDGRLFDQAERPDARSGDHQLGMVP